MVNYRAIHLLSYFRTVLGTVPGMFPVAERIGDATISLPLYPRLSHDQVRIVAGGIADVVRTVYAEAVPASAPATMATIGD